MSEEQQSNALSERKAKQRGTTKQRFVRAQGEAKRNNKTKFCPSAG